MSAGNGKDTGAPASRTRLNSGGRPDAAAPPLRLALQPGEAARALGVSKAHFDRHVRPVLPVKRCGELRLYSIEVLNAWLATDARAPIEDVEP